MEPFRGHFSVLVGEWVHEKKLDNFGRSCFDFLLLGKNFKVSISNFDILRYNNPSRFYGWIDAFAILSWMIALDESNKICSDLIYEA